jgi:hypothetical protein
VPEGRSLEELLKARPVDREKVDALKAKHSDGLIHVEFDWSNEFGLCEDCGDLPASYFAPDLVVTHHKLSGEVVVQTGHKLCPICAAMWASYGERLERLWQEDEDA